jgi:hypothetical protein
VYVAAILCHWITYMLCFVKMVVILATLFKPFIIAEKYKHGITGNCFCTPTGPSTGLRNNNLNEIVKFMALL